MQLLVVGEPMMQGRPMTVAPNPQRHSSPLALQVQQRKQPCVSALPLLPLRASVECCTFSASPFVPWHKTPLPLLRPSASPVAAFPSTSLRRPFRPVAFLFFESLPNFFCFCKYVHGHDLALGLFMAIPMCQAFDVMLAPD